MRVCFVLPLACAFALAACNNSDTVEGKNESIESVAKKVAASDLRPRPGRWESTMTIEKLDMPNLPPQAKEVMQKQMGGGQTFATCLTPEQAAKPGADFFQGKDSGCSYDRFSMTGGKVDAVMTCTQQGRTQKVTMAGTYGEEAYTMHLTSEGEAQPGMPMSMVMSVSSKRVGECDRSETP
jgi:hypothetical protein